MNVSPLFFSWLVFLLSGTTLLAVNNFNDVTVSDYVQFLNVVAKADPHILYSERMGEESGIALVERVGEPGNYSYHFREDQADEPVMFVDIRSAMRFCNWKENGEQEDTATTEHGVYELEMDRLIAVHIDEKTNYFLPEENDKIASEYHPCLKLGSLEDPASWLRSDELVFHLKGRLENIGSFLRQEKPASERSWPEDVGYGVAAITGMVAVAVEWKYRNTSYFRRAPDESVLEQIDENGVTREAMRNKTEQDQSEIDSLGLENSRSAPTTAVPQEKKEQRFYREAQTIINQKIYSRTQMMGRALLLTSGSRDQIQLDEPFEERVNAVRVQGTKFIQFFKNNFEKIFDYQNRTKMLEKLMEPYMKKLKEKIHDSISSGLLSKTLTFIHDPLPLEHQNIIEAAEKYCADFDESWKQAFEATTLEHRFFEEFQLKVDWINKFSELIQTVQTTVNTELEEGAVGEIRNLRTCAIKQFFDITFRKQFDGTQQLIETQRQEALAKVPGWHQELEALSFWNRTSSEQAQLDAQAIVDAAHQETETLVNAYNDWRFQTGDVIRRAGQRYDAVNHVFPQFGEDLNITENQRKLIIEAVNGVNLKLEIQSCYPTQEQEQLYLERWVQEQYNTVVGKLKSSRGWIQVLTSPQKALTGELMDHEKDAVRWFLDVLESSPVDFIQAHGKSLKEQLASESDDSDSDLPF